MGDKNDEEDFDYWEDYNWCYECGGYGDDYSYDPETGDLVSNCDNCPHNKHLRNE